MSPKLSPSVPVRLSGEHRVARSLRCPFKNLKLRKKKTLKLKVGDQYIFPSSQGRCDRPGGPLHHPRSAFPSDHPPLHHHQRWQRCHQPECWLWSSAIQTRTGKRKTDCQFEEWTFFFPREFNSDNGTVWNLWKLETLAYFLFSVKIKAHTCQEPVRWYKKWWARLIYFHSQSFNWTNSDHLNCFGLQCLIITMRINSILY